MARKRKDSGLLDIALQSPWPVSASLSALTLFGGFVVLPRILAGSLLSPLTDSLRPIVYAVAAVFGIVAVFKLVAQSAAAPRRTMPRQFGARSNPRKRKRRHPRSANSEIGLRPRAINRRSRLPFRLSVRPSGQSTSCSKSNGKASRTSASPSTAPKASARKARRSVRTAASMPVSTRMTQTPRAARPSVQGLGRTPRRREAGARTAWRDGARAGGKGFLRGAGRLYGRGKGFRPPDHAAGRKTLLRDAKAAPARIRAVATSCRNRGRLDDAKLSPMRDENEAASIAKNRFLGLRTVPKMSADYAYERKGTRLMPLIVLQVSSHEGPPGGRQRTHLEWHTEKFGALLSDELNAGAHATGSGRATT